MAPEATQILYTISTVLAGVFLSALPARVRKLRKSSIRNAQSWQLLLKAALGIILAIILFSYWTSFSIANTQHETSFLLSLGSSILAALGLSILSLLEQQRSYGASDSATLYLLASIICDGIYLLMPNKAPGNTDAQRPLLLRCCLHCILLVLEWHARDVVLSDPGKYQDPEQSRSVLSRALFIWINPILLRGYHSILTDQDIPYLCADMKPDYTRKEILRTWSQRAKPETKKALPLALMRSLKRPFLLAIIPRLFLICFRYSQPILIRKVIRYVVVLSADPGGSRGFWLIISAVVVYVGLAISTALYQDRINRLKLMTRSSLVGLIHDKTMKSPSIAYDDGEATTLMSTDTDSLEGTGEMFHEIWAQVIEVIVGITLLASQVGWIWPLPLFLIYCNYVSKVL